MNEEKKVEIYSYSKVWKVQKKIYAIQNFVLPVPIDPWQLLYFGMTWFVCSIIFGTIPGLKIIPAMIRNIIFPYFISKFLMTKKLDGKNPLRYAIGLIVYLFVEHGKSMERFQMQSIRNKVIKINWNCSQGQRLEGDYVSVSN